MSQKPSVQYYLLIRPVSGNGQAIEAMLNRQAEAGWRVVAVTSLSDSNVMFVLAREYLPVD